MMFGYVDAGFFFHLNDKVESLQQRFALLEQDIRELQAQQRERSRTPPGARGPTEKTDT